MSPAEPNKRRAQTSRRRREVLDAALACFTELGFDATSMADVCRRAGASVGSVYHHFKSKEQLAGALFIDGLRDYQEGLLRALGRIDPGRPGSGRRLVRTMVAHYLRWVEANAARARYLIEFGRGPLAGALDEELQTLNRAFFARVEQALAPAVARGELRRLPRDVASAQIFGPARDFARRWLRERTETSLTVARGVLADAAYRSMRPPKQPED